MSVLFFAGALSLLAFALPSFGQSAPLAITENAHPKSYGDGWECDVSYRVDGDRCTAITVPQNAYPTNQTYGSGWACLRGFEAVGGDSCVEIEVPEGAYETLAGFVLDRLGRIPEVGDSFVCDEWQVRVAEMDDHRVAMVRLVAPPPGAIADEAVAH